MSVPEKPSNRLPSGTSAGAVDAVGRRSPAKAVERAGAGDGPVRDLRGFTLTELLVTIAVIAILATLLMVGIGKAREAAQNAKSASNLRQIGAGLQLYINANGGEIMPRAANPASQNEGGYRYWTAALYGNGYVEAKEVFYDPAFPPHGPENSERAQNFTGQIQQTFGMRGWIKPGAEQPQLSRRTAKQVSVVEEPADFFIVADSIWLNWMAQGYGISPNHSNQKVRLNDKGTATALFLDGHVAEMPADYFLELGETQGKYSDGEPYDVWHPGDS